MNNYSCPPFHRLLRGSPFCVSEEPCNSPEPQLVYFTMCTGDHCFVWRVCIPNYYRSKHVFSYSSLHGSFYSTWASLSLGQPCSFLYNFFVPSPLGSHRSLPHPILCPSSSLLAVQMVLCWCFIIGLRSVWLTLTHAYYSVVHHHFPFYVCLSTMSPKLQHHQRFRINRMSVSPYLGDEEVAL